MIDGNASGKGKLQSHLDGLGKAQTIRYIGPMKNGRRHGEGAYIAANGDCFEGLFREGKAVGRGFCVIGDQIYQRDLSELEPMM